MTATAPRISAMREIAGRWRRPAMVAGLAFVILIGATPLGEVASNVQLIMVLIGAWAVWAAVRQVRVDADSSDQLALLSYLLLVICVVFSNFPRQSVDIAISGLGVLAIFWLARREMVDDGSRRAAMALLTTIALFVGAVALLAWGGIWVHWLTTVGTLPPELSLPGFVFGNVHDVAILVLLCAPAALIDRSGWRRLVAQLAVLVAVGVATIDGSRNVLLAAGIATVVVGGVTVSRARASWPIKFVPGLVIAVVVLLTLAVWTGFLARMINPDTLGVRIWLWTASVDAWLADPIFGHGPGTFPWLLSLTDYFTHTTFAPRHPDNALAQLLAEGGLVGVAAGASAMAAVLVGMRGSGPPRAAIWALTFFAACGLFANPTDFGFLVVPAVLWAGLASVRYRRVPTRESANDGALSRRTGFSRLTASVGLMAVVMALSYPLAGVIHDMASADLAAGDQQAAEAELRYALWLDPAMALYDRELGTLLLGTGEVHSARIHLDHAVSANGSDLAALRLLAIAAQADGDAIRALQAAQEVVERRPSEAVGLLTLAQIRAAQGDTEGALDLVTQVLLDSPWLSGALDLDQMGIDSTTGGALDRATDLWLTLPVSQRSPIILAWLTALSGNLELRQMAVDAAGSAGVTVQALQGLFDCQPNHAQQALNSAETAGLRSEWYWAARYMVEQTISNVEPETRWFMRYLSPVAPISTTPAAAAVHNDLNDRWGYGRRPVEFAPRPEMPPSEVAGLVEWMRDPVGTAAARVPDRPLATCGMSSVETP